MIVKWRRAIYLTTILLATLIINRLIPFEYKFFLKPSTRNVIASTPYYIDNWGWRLYLNGSFNDSDAYSFDKYELDTAKHLILGIEDGDATNVFEYYKDFKSPKGKINVLMNSHDTLWCFINDGSGHKRFLVGGYFYKWTNLELEKEEMDYFLLYKDSLSNIRGNYLPILPTLTKVERVAFNRKFK